MGYNAIEIDGDVKLDLSQDTVTEETLPEGVTAHDANGDPIEGKMKFVKSVNSKTGDVTLGAEDVGARPDTWTPSAEDVGARPNTWMPSYSDVNADKAGTAQSLVSTHNTNDAAHNDIRLELQRLAGIIADVLDSDDTTLDEMHEVVAYIKSNKALIEAITTSKVNVADIINNLTTNVTNKPLSAAQGVALKALVDALGTNKLDASALTSAINTALAQAKASGAFDGADGTSVTVKSVSESTADGGSNVVTFSDGKTVAIRNGKNYVLTDADIKEIAEIVAGDNLPDYWEEYLPDKIATIKALQDEGGKDCFSFVVITDMHYEQNIGKLSPKLAKKIADECGIKYALILGDSGTRNGILKDLAYIDNEWDNIEKMITPIRDRLLMTDGNHDGSYGATDGDGDGVIDDVHGTGNSAYNWSPKKKYNRIKRKVSLIEGVTFDESGCGYYADDKTAKIRYIVLSTHNNKYEENADGSSKYSNMFNFRYGQSQFDLVIKALNTLEEGWSVLVASHVPLDRSGELLPWGATEVEDNRLVSGEVECWLMADVLNAFVNKTTHKGTFTGTQGATATYKNLADKTSADWLKGYRTSSSGTSQESGYDVTNFLGDGVTPVGDMTIYYKNAKVSNQRMQFLNANKEIIYNVYPTNFTDREGFDGTATEGRLFIDKEKNAVLSSTAVYVRLCLVSGDDAPIITLDEPIEASGASFDAVSVDVDFTSAKGDLIGYFGGHVHKDATWGKTYTWDGRLKQCDFWTIATRCDGHNENDSALYAERVAGTTTEQSFNVFTVNKATRRIYATKIGAGEDFGGDDAPIIY
jgi:hypothetical protein